MKAPRGYGSLREEPGKTFLRYYLHGKQREALLMTKDPKALPSGERPAATEKEVADARLKFIKELAAGKRRPFEATRVTVNELLDRLIRWSKQEGIGEYQDRGRVIKPDPKWPKDRPHGSASLDSHLKPIRLAFGHRKALSITTDDTDEYKKRMVAEGYEHATINRGLEKLIRAYSWAAGLKGENKPPLIDPRDVLRVSALDESGNVRQTYFNRAQFETLMGHIGEEVGRGAEKKFVVDVDVQHFCLWMIRLGMRRGEAGKLSWPMFDRRDWTIRIPGRITKGGKRGPGRVVALTGLLKTLIEERLKVRKDLEGCPWIFHRDGKKMGSFRKMWLTAVGKVPGLIKTVTAAEFCACRKSGTDHKHVPTPHDLRRSAAVVLDEDGESLPMIMKILDLKTVSMLIRYTIGDVGRLREAMAEADKKWEARPIALEPAGELAEGEFGAQKGGRK